MRNLLGRITLLTLVGLGLSTPSQAYNWFDYFLSTPGVCTAGNPSDPGTYTYTYDAHKNCNVPGRGSVPLYLLYKGGWADENYVAHNGWLYLLSERHPNLCATTSGYREFDAGGTYGLPYAKLTSAGYETWNVPSFTLHCGPSCKTNNLNIFQAGGEPNEQALLGTIWDKLYDCRSGPCNGPIPMEVVMTRGYLYPHSGTSCGTHYDAIEEYWFGRADITNDGVANPQSIGFVHFVDLVYNHTTCGYDEGPATGWNGYLKNCTVAASCPYC
jgi:hypothetical protein